MSWFLFLFLCLRVLFGQSHDLVFQPPSLFHRSCLEWVATYHLHPMFSGLICGQSLPPIEKNLFLNLGVYHWIVASGGHLIFLQTMIETWLTKNKLIIIFILFVYSLVCGLQPPIVRSLFALTLSLLSIRFALFLNSSQNCLNSGLLTLLFFPLWFDSFSFQLSWLTALALQQAKSEGLKCFMISLVLFPLSQTWSLLHLFYNLLLTPLFSRILFPLTFLLFALAPITNVGSRLWVCLLKMAEVLPAQHVNLTQMSSPIPTWIYIGILQSLLYLKERKFHGT